MSLRLPAAIPLIAFALCALLFVGACGNSGDGPADTPSPAPSTSPLTTVPTATPPADRGELRDAGATVRRVSDTSERGGFETQEYSQLQAFSADNTFLLLDGSEGFVVRRVDDFTLVPGLDTSAWNTPRWHPAAPRRDPSLR